MVSEKDATMEISMAAARVETRVVRTVEKRAASKGLKRAAPMVATKVVKKADAWVGRRVL